MVPKSWYSTWQLYKQGEVSKEELFRVSMAALAAIDDSMQSFKETQVTIRNVLSELVALTPEFKISIDDVGTAILTKPSAPTPSYDYRGIDLVANQLRLEGLDDIADRLTAYRKLGEPRAGSLRITRPNLSSDNDDT